MAGLGFFSDTHLQAFAVSIAKRITAFIETGMEEGKTTQWAAKHFERVYTCEIDAKYLVREIFELLPRNVYLYSISSPQFLVEVAPLAGDLPLFFLDAHWFDYWPLHDELKMIELHYRKGVLIVHDCNVPGRANFWACKGGGADHDGPVLDWEYIKLAINAKHYKLFYPNYATPTNGMPGYCLLFKDMEPMGNLKDMKECPI